MKKIILAVILGASVWNVMAFAQWEKRYSLGGAFSAAWQKMGENENRAYAGSINFNSLGFYGNFPIGYFGAISIGYPREFYYNDIIIDLEMGYIIQAIIGPAFRIDCTDKIKIIAGIGAHLAQFAVIAFGSMIDNAVNGNEMDYEIYYPWNYGIGVGGIAGVNILLTEWLFVDIGSTFAYDFSSSAYDNYSTFHIVPYIGLGIKAKSLKPLIQL
jgi:hypothetical protein